MTKLKSSATADTLIVTSIQKMSNIHLGTPQGALSCSEGAIHLASEPTRTINDEDIQRIRAKRLVFIVDEAHRSTFGKMLTTIKQTFPQALFLALQAHPFRRKTKRKTTPRRIFLGMNFIDTALQTAFVIKMS